MVEGFGPRVFTLKRLDKKASICIDKQTGVVKNILFLKKKNQRMLVILIRVETYIYEYMCV